GPPDRFPFGQAVGEEFHGVEIEILLHQLFDEFQWRQLGFFGEAGGVFGQFEARQDVAGLPGGDLRKFTHEWLSIGRYMLERWKLRATDYSTAILQSAPIDIVSSRASCYR